MKKRAGTTKGGARRADILLAARRLLQSEGAEGFALRRVADKLSLRLGHVQYYFATRGELLGAVFDEHLRTSAERMRAQFPGETLTRAQLVGAIELLLLEQEDPAHSQLFFEAWALAGRDKPVRAKMRKFYASFQAEVACWLARAVPGLSDGAAASRAAVLVALLEGASLFRSGTLGQKSAGLDASVRAELIKLATRRP